MPFPGRRLHLTEMFQKQQFTGKQRAVISNNGFWLPSKPGKLCCVLPSTYTAYTAPMQIWGKSHTILPFSRLSSDDVTEEPHGNSSEGISSGYVAPSVHVLPYWLIASTPGLILVSSPCSYKDYKNCSCVCENGQTCTTVPRLASVCCI